MRVAFGPAWSAPNFLDKSYGYFLAARLGHQGIGLDRQSTNLLAVDPGGGQALAQEKNLSEAGPTEVARTNPASGPEAGEGDRLGYTRILGELKKLGVKDSRSTIVTIS